MMRSAPQPGLARTLVLASATLAVYLLSGSLTPARAQSALNLRLQGQQTGDTSVRPLREFSTRELGDAWDMNERSDIGWFTWGIDNPASLLSSRRITTDAQGLTVFDAASSSPAPSFFLLDTWVPGTGKLGKTGATTPIDTSVYTSLYVKIKVDATVLSTAPVAQVFWSRDTIYHDAAARPTGGAIAAFDNDSGNQAGLFLSPYVAPTWGRLEGDVWVIVRLPLTLSAMQANNAIIDRWRNMASGATEYWGSAGVWADSLRVSPFNIDGDLVGPFQIDWVRLVDDRAPTGVAVTWSGGAHDVVVSTRSDCSQFAVVAYSQSSGFTLNAGVLPPARYYVGLRKPFTYTGHTAASPTTLEACSAATVTVPAWPSLTLTSPHPEGSQDDFATSVLGNPWDFDAMTDVDHTHEIRTEPTSDPAPYGLVSRAATDVNGVNLGAGAPVRVLRSWTDSGNCPDHQVPAGGCVVGDPHLYFLRSAPGTVGGRARGEQMRIDASRYRIVTAEVGIEWDRDLLSGSLGRLVWHVDGDTRLDGAPVEIESEEIVVRHVPTAENGGRLMLDTIQADLADRASLPIETDHPSWASGWNNGCTPTPGAATCVTSGAAYRPGVSAFRYDLHEFSGREPDGQTVRRRMPSTIRRLKLAALERTGAAFTVSWLASNPSGVAATVTLSAVPEADPARQDRRPRDRACRTTHGAVPIASGLAFGAGSYVWRPASTSGLTTGAEYYVCAQVAVNGEVVDEELSRWPVVVSPGFAELLVSRPGELRYKATKGAGSALLASTGAQAVRLDGPVVNWTATADRPWLRVTGGAGTGAGQFTVEVVNPSNVMGDVTTTLYGTITITAAASSGVPTLTIPVLLQVDTGGGVSGTPPFGTVDTPVQSTTGLQGTVGVTGWALDDVGIDRVRLYRGCLWFEPVTNCAWVLGRHVVYVGDATRVTGARPDVETLFQRYPDAGRAAWGYTLLTNLLPHVPAQQMVGGEGALTLGVLATDVEGRSAWLQWPVPPANTTFTIDGAIGLANATIARPFGAIDTPAQGATVSGTFHNFGWVLTPDANTTSGPNDVLMPTAGATIRLYIDGVPQQTVTYDLCRGSIPRPVFCDDDVAGLFGNVSPMPPLTPRQANPTVFRNLDAGRGAIGVTTVDSTRLSNGLHTIVWGATDSAGRTEGIGSRYFAVLNGGSREALAERADTDAASRDALSLDRPVWTMPIRGRVGFDLDAPLRVLPADADGHRLVRLAPLGRLELALPGVTAGYWLAAGEVRGLPAGSFLDLAAGVFTWSPPAGFLGRYALVFLVDDARVPVTVTIVGAMTGAPGVRMGLHQPRPVGTSGTPVAISGWVYDPEAAIGSGIDAVHVWAERQDGPSSPVFLGAAVLDVASPEAAEAHGAEAALAGFSLTAPSLQPGTYRVTAYAWAHRTGRWEDARSVLVTVR